MKERITCRLNIPDELARQGLTFVPEECRVLNGTDRARCLTNYDWLQRCRHLSADPDRNKCYLAQINVTNIATHRIACGSNLTCLDDLREKVFGFVKFRIYNLEEKAELLADRELITEDQAIDFIQILELKKQSFNDAKNVTAKKAVVKEIQTEWQNLRVIVVDALKAKAKQ